MNVHAISSAAPQPAPAPSVLKLEDVTVRFGDRDILRDVSFSLQPGQFLGVIGTNGAGKTTLLRTLLGLIHPTAGQIRIFGHPPRRGNTAIGYVPQHQTFDRDVPLRAQDYVQLGLDGDRWGIGRPDPAAKQRVVEALDAVGAGEYASSPIGRLSGGQQQRLLLAQAIVGNPRLLLLDEPLANLDLRSRWEVVSLVKCLTEEREIAVVFVAHDINPLLDALDSVLYLAHGRAVCGAVDQVIRSDVLSRLYGFPVEVVRAGGHVLVAGALEGDDCHA